MREEHPGAKGTSLFQKLPRFVRRHDELREHGLTDEVRPRKRGDQVGDVFIGIGFGCLGILGFALLMFYGCIIAFG